MQMRVDEPGNKVLAGDIDDLAPFVAVTDADDGFAADRDITRQQVPGHGIKDHSAPQDQVGRHTAPRLVDQGL